MIKIKQVLNKEKKEVIFLKLLLKLLTFVTSPSFHIIDIIDSV